MLSGNSAADASSSKKIADVSDNTETVDISGLSSTDIKEDQNSISKASEDQIAAAITGAEDLPSYASLVKSGEVVSLEGDSSRRAVDNLTFLNVDLQLAKFCGQTAVKTFNEYNEKKHISIPLKGFLEQSLQMMKVLEVIRYLAAELSLSDETYIYLHSASENLGCQMLVKLAILKRNPLMFRLDDGTWQNIVLVKPSYLKLWYKLALLLTKPEFRKYVL